MSYYGLLGYELPEFNYGLLTEGEGAMEKKTINHERTLEKLRK